MPPKRPRKTTKCEFCGLPLESCECEIDINDINGLIDLINMINGNIDPSKVKNGPSDPPKDKNQRKSRKNIPEARITSKDFILNKTEKPIETLEDLIKILDHENAKSQQKSLVSNLVELNNLVGMNQLKQQIINQILFFIQDLTEPGTFLHTVITGAPGCGKTSIINILSKIYNNLGLLKTNKILKVDRSDLIAEYLGQTAVKTKKVLESAKGGILLIDEAYSLGSGKDGNRDSFAKECVDTINQYLSEHVDEFVCIIAGYENQIKKCFFDQNDGLERRFPWRFNISEYSSEELCEILYRQLGKWIISADRSYVLSKIKEHRESFGGNGGDTRNLLDKCKIFYARRMFKEKCENQTLDPDKLVKISIPLEIKLQDFDSALKNYLETKKNSSKLCEFCTEYSEEQKKRHKCENCEIRKKNSDSLYL